MEYNHLTPDEEWVILHKGTERPFTGELLNNKAQGVYVCKRCDTPLYTSESKFESHCGWPSFFDPADSDAVILRADHSMGATRTEVLCARCDGHLGHVFDDGPRPTGLRYCMNGVAMTFKPATT